RRRPGGDEPRIKRVDIRSAKHGGELVDAVAGEQSSEPPWKRRVQGSEEPVPGAWCNGVQDRCCSGAQGRWDVTRPRGELDPRDVTAVAAEKLVAAVAGERHGDVLTGEAGHEVSGDLRSVGEGLVVDDREQRYDRHGLLW